MDLSHFYNQIFFCTTRIAVATSTTESSVGTGFLVHAPVGTDRQIVLLISNKHVFVGAHRTAKVTLHKKDPASAEPKPFLGHVHSESIILDNTFTEHPDPSVDLACVNVSGIANPSLNLFYKTLPIEMSASYDEPWLMPNSEVCFVGYPDGRYDTKNMLPILRSGRIASIPQADFNGTRQLVIDAHVHRGSSGSPVIAIPPPFSGASAVFLGVLTQTMIRGEQLQTIAAVPGVAVPLTIGLGLVLKAELVRELVQAATLKVLATLGTALSLPVKAATSTAA